LLILGSSGTGKTTLLHLLAGLRKPTSGEVEVNGVKLSSLSGASLDRFRGKNIGVVFQTSHFVQSLSVLDNILLAPYFSNNKVSKSDAEKMLAMQEEQFKQRIMQEEYKSTLRTLEYEQKNKSILSTFLHLKN
jgi:putative ABC transport system ATP-binding protein